MGKPTYQIKDWDKHFENHESRKVKRSYWVPVPNRHDGKSYRRIAAHPEGVAVFAAWVLILQAASKMPTRGVLADEDGPLDSEDLAAMTGFPAPIFDAAFNLLTQDKFGWITSTQKRVKAVRSPGISRNLPESPGTPGEIALEQKGTEGNRTEGNGMEDQRSEAARVSEVFDFWKTEMQHPGAQLSPERRKKIQQRLTDSTVEEVKTAVQGCKLSDFHMGREPGKSKVFDDIELICRNRSKLEDFIAIASRANGNYKQNPRNRSSAESDFEFKPKSKVC